MSKHTPGPWRAVDKRPNSAGFSIFSDSQFVGFIGDSDQNTDCAANAKRIVDCVNALDGLNNDALDGGWSFNGITEYCKRSESEKNELLTILEQIIDRWDTPDAPGTAEYINAARKIVAKVKGGK